MKSRRLTVVCMAAIALIGTPRAWQEIGNLLELAQQKAQMKFWSMVMRPAGPAEVELIAAEESAPAHDISPCPHKHSQVSLEPVSYREARRPRAAARRERRGTGAQGLIAHARKIPADKESVERAIRLAGLKDADFDFSDIAESIPAPQPARGAKALPQPRPATPDTLSFVQLPDMAPVAAALGSDKEVTYQFKLMKKSLIENRGLLRQKGRFPAVRVSAPTPES